MVLLTTLSCCLLRAEESDGLAIEFFEKKIRPVLVEHCYECHAAGAEKIRAGLLLDTREGIRRGGDSGSAVSPGKPEESLLLDAIRYETFEMPPEGPLPEEVVADFEHWISLGASDPRDGPSKQIAREIDFKQGRQFWSYQAPQPVFAPEVSDAQWPRTEIDQFLLARLEAEGLKPVADADRVTLIRRAYYALIGLPPTVDEIDDFVDDTATLPIAFATVVDRLLGSKHFGERWGRHWLDVARFAESSGGGRSLLLPEAWRYRDYVIESFNQDLPYDQFIMQQIAGDLMEASDWRERRLNITATAFLVLGPTNYELQDKEVLEMDIVDEQLITIGRGLLGMTIGCARCHDHKFDPIPTRDYYALAGILKSTKSVIHSNVSKWNTTPLPLPPEEKKVFEENPKRLAAMAVVDREQVGDIPLAIRGDVHNVGPIIPRGMLEVAWNGEMPKIPAKQSGRMQLAEWIISAENPLTTRVMVNRIWNWLFGQGLVRTVDNFGTTGDLPTHPELLDYLALQFVEDGWSVKRMIRRLMLSRVYQLRSTNDPVAIATAETIDPSNQLYQRMNRQRLDAESLRDTLLFLGGNLDFTMGGSNIKEGTKSEYGYEFDSFRRSTYVPVFRNELPAIFETFDFADPNIQVGRRNQSTTAPQALLLMNNPWVMEQATIAAKRLLMSEEKTADQRLIEIYRQVLGREPGNHEAKLTRQFIGEADDVERWGLLYHTLFQSLDFRFLD